MDAKNSTFRDSPPAIWPTPPRGPLTDLCRAGQLILEFFKHVIKPPVDHRRDQWMGDLANAIHELPGAQRR
jgi:hypothetical protein